MHRRGFTILELIIVTAAFSVIFLIATTVYTNAFRTQRKIQTTQRTSSDARYLMETIARSIRINAIDYVCYAEFNLGHTTSCDSNPAHTATIWSELSLLDAQQQGSCYKFDSSTHKILFASSGCIKADYDTTHGVTPPPFQDITPSDLSIDAFSATISPTTSPYGTAVGRPDVQPHVTIYMKSHATVRGERTDSTIQTTVVSRTYQR